MEDSITNRTPAMVASMGFALLLVVSAIQVWGGVFAFVSETYESNNTWFIAYTLQNVFCIVSFFVAIAYGYFFPRMMDRRFACVFALVMLAAPVLVYLAVQGSEFHTALIYCASICSGIASAGLALLWQRVWSAMPQDDSNNGILIGTILGSALYLLFRIMPASASLFLFPILVIVGSACLLYAEAHMNCEQSMFQDIPREYTFVYQRLIHDLWRTLVCIAAIAFSCGLARGFAVADASGSASADFASAIGSLASAIILLVLSRTFRLRFGMSRIFRFIFPLMIIAALLFPFMRSTGLTLFTGLVHVLFSLTLLVLWMQSAQICRDRGVSPTFVFSLLCSALYAAQLVGFFVGWEANHLPGFLPGESVMLSLAGSAAMGLALFAMTRGFALSDSRVGRAEEVEFLRSRRKVGAEGLSDSMLQSFEEDPADSMRQSFEEDAADATRQSFEEDAPDSMRQSFEEGVLDANQASDASLLDDALEVNGEGKQDAASLIAEAPLSVASYTGALPVTDRISKQCLIAQRNFGLSTRETEVMEQIARGRSVAAIANLLSISENTVRTHSKHIYTKLDVHSKSALGSLLETMDVASFDDVTM